MLGIYHESINTKKNIKMSREIKFRAFIKNEIGGFMIPSEDSDCFMVSNGNGFIVYDENKNTLQENEFEIMQQTGIKDLNGNVIFEGDIIEIPDDYDTYGFNAGEIYEIFFNVGGFRCKPKLNPKAKGIWLEDDGEFEIIGNIYQNPDLRPS